MVSYISASYIYPITGAPIKNGVLGVDGKGVITAVLSHQEAKAAGIEHISHYEGLLVPGFVNTHCHLELSHLKGQIARHTGLVDFVQSVMTIRTADEDVVTAAMQKADAEMFEKGIVAVADIANQQVSKSVKISSKLYYHTLLEAMGFNPLTAGARMIGAKALRRDFKPLSVSTVPHAPYSVSENLFDLLKAEGEEYDGLFSIHNQETADENTFFERKAGRFLDLYQFLGLDIDFYEPTGKTSLQSFLPWVSADLKTLLVHNTFTSREDVAYAGSVHKNLYWCLCPSANLYIENRLPDVPMLMESGLRITLGTDSLASNDKLDILAEMRVLQEHFAIPAEVLLKWATLNGAAFLGIEGSFGSLEIGKQPGINLVAFEKRGGLVILGTEVVRLY